MMSDIFKMFAKLFLVIAVIFTIFLYLFSIVLGPAMFYFTTEGQTTSMNHLPALPIWLLNQSIAIPVEVNIGVLFFVLWSIFTLSFVAAWKVRENFHKVIKESIFQPIKKLFTSSLFVMPLLNSMTLLVVILIQSIQEAGGIPTGTPPIPGESFFDFLDLSYAAVIEEVGFRFIPIGAFMVLYMFIIKKKTNTQFSKKQNLKLFFASILFPDSAKRMVGTTTVNEYGIKRGISPGEWGMLLFTSLIFGMAHFNPGVSWELGKISSAGIAGVALGLSYLLYGAHSSIIMHWFFNAYTNTFVLLSEIYPVVAPLATVVTILTLILGILGWLVVVSFGFLKLAQRSEKSQEQITPSSAISLE